MQENDSAWMERELLLFFDGSRRWIFFVGSSIVSICLLAFFQMILYGMGLMMVVAFSIPVLLLGSTGFFLIAASRKASEAFQDRTATRPALKYLLVFFRTVGILLGIVLIQAIVGFIQFVMDF